MDVLPCGHVANEGTGRVCPHLIGPEAPTEHFRLLRGHRLDSDFACAECESDLSQGGAPDLAVVCEGCVDRLASGRWSLLGWRGAPGIDERPEPQRAVDIGPPLGGPGLASPRAVAPFDRGWVTVAPDGGVWAHVGGDDHQVGDLAQIAGVGDLLDLDGLNGWSFTSRNQPTVAVHASADGRFAAVVVDHGRAGAVLDLTSGTATLPLDRADYHAEWTRFPVTFVTAAGHETVVVAATGWNRVDAFDAATGRLLTPRPSLSHGPGQDRPEHYLDYFHGALHASPDGRWVLDDGWVWQPVGIPSAWSVERWLGANVWESEDGPSLAMFCQRSYLWDVPMCWVDERLVAIWGLGFDDEAMLDGVAVYDVEDVVLVKELAGVPRGHLWSDGRRLLAAGAGDGGLSVWDPFTGQRTAQIPDLAPIAFNRWLGELLVEADDGRLRRVHLRPA